MTCRMLNATGQEYWSGSIAIQFKNEGHAPNTGFMTQIVGKKIPVDGWHEFVVPKESFGQKVDVNTGQLDLRENGFIFANAQGKCKTISFADAARLETRIEIDSSAPPLTEQEVKVARDCVRSGLEGASPHPIPLWSVEGEDTAAAAVFWRWVAEQMGRRGEGLEAGRELWQIIQKYFCDASMTSEGSPVAAIKNHPRRPTISTNRSSQAVAKLLIDGAVRVEVYHRALSRYPGGNADIVVACHVYTPDDTSLRAASFRNWDGSSTLSDNPAPFPDTASTFRDNVLARWADMLNADHEQQLLDAEATIVDEADSWTDSAAWTSIELIAYEVSPGAPHMPLARIHQHPLYVNLYPTPESPSLAKPASAAMQAVLDGVERVLEMGSAESFGLEEVAAAARLAAAAGSSPLWCGCVDPIYFAGRCLP